MNYRHIYHAGNFADVFKHIMLSRIVLYLQRKDKPFRVFDTHSGIGLYDLTSEEAQKTLEAQSGVDRVLATRAPKDVHAVIEPWKDIVNSMEENKFPGSPLVAHKLLRKIDRLSLYEMHPEDAAVLKSLFADDYQTRVNEQDGWLVPVSHIPPKEGRGLTLVDPPFEDGKDFDRMIKLLTETNRRWRGSTVALWYPVKKREHTDEWLESLKMLGFDDLLNMELYIRHPRSASSLNGCGIVILNPPYTLKEEMGRVLPWLAETLKEDVGSGYRIQDLSKK